MLVLQVDLHSLPPVPLVQRGKDCYGFGGLLGDGVDVESLVQEFLVLLRQQCGPYFLSVFRAFGILRYLAE